MEKGTRAMAAETKIGLVIGLAFIVCFAVILTHRGEGDRLNKEMAHQLLTHQRAQPTTPSGGPSPNRILPQVRQGPAVRAAASPAHRPPRTQGETTNESEPAQHTSPTATPPEKPDLATALVTSMTGGNANPGVAKEEVRAVAVKPDTKPTFESLFGPGETDPAVSTAPKPDESADRETRRNQPASGATRYVVRPKDTLWGIAQAVYGVRSKEVVNAIYAANRSRMKSPDALAIGMELVLPPVDGLPSPADRAPQRSATPAQPQNDARNGLPTYQVRQGDRYVTIAERLLGDRARWREIHELNRAVFPDPSRIQHGVRIRLPADAHNGAG